MEKNLDQWNDIAELINKDKQKALDDFRSRGFELAHRPGHETVPLLGRHRVVRPVYVALAASLLLITGLILFWAMHGNWSSVPTTPTMAQLLADSLLYSQAGIAERETSPCPSLPAATPFFPAWVAAELAPGAVTVPVEPSARIEHGDPAEVRRRIERAIDQDVFKQLLLTMQEFQNKEV